MRYIFIIFILGYSWVFFNLLKIHFLKHNIFKQKLYQFTTITIYTPPNRALILDRNLKEIAQNKSELAITIQKTKLQLLDKTTKQKIINSLNKYFNNDIQKLISESYVDKVIIKKKPDINDISFITENLYYLYGVNVDIFFKRYYPYKSALSFITGFVNMPSSEEIKNNSELFYYDYVGKDGLEKEYDDFLRGKLGYIKYQIEPDGTPFKILDKIEPINNYTLKTTIDVNIQLFIYNELKKLCDNLSIKNNQPVGGSVVLIKTNGEVLALVSYPSYDPNTLEPDYNNIIKKYPSFSFYLNRAISGEYPPASTFKIITSLAALNENIIYDKTKIYCPGYFFVGNHPFYCFNTSGHGYLDIYSALAYSCDVFYYQLGYKLGIDKIKKYCEILGLSKPTGIDLPYEANGLIPDKSYKMKYFNEEWTKGDDVNSAIGQGMVLVTPIQMAVAVNSIATGYKITPFINYQNISKKIKLNINQKKLRIIRESMRNAVDFGTASVVKYKVKKYVVAGKTGTAEVPANSNNPKGLNNTWFVCFFDFYKPEYVLVVSLEGSGGYGGEYAANLAADIINFITTKLNY
ncbi:MAG: penicillin-binding transpeptidase domain-containing protein [bacterium]|nr:penicillin-binding transpeptidase domain-containing protein [bacterium]